MISVSRILALTFYYHSPMSVVYNFQVEELPRLLNDTGFLPVYPPNTPEEEIPRIDLSPVKHFNLTLCVAKEWYRFPGHYLVPPGIRVDFVKSDFDGLLPGHFGEGELKKVAGENVIAPWIGWNEPATRQIPAGLNDLNREQPAFYVSFWSATFLYGYLKSVRSRSRHATTCSTWTFPNIRAHLLSSVAMRWMRSGTASFAPHFWTLDIPTS
jgi:alpha-1,2-mannosyltransferase